MPRACLRISVLLLALPLAGFSSRLKVAIINNAGQELAISVGKEHQAVAPGQLTKMRYPDSAVGWKLTVTGADCTYVFVLPKNLETYRWLSKLHGTLPLQIESDFRLYAVPPGQTAISDLAQIAPLQSAGFPLNPADRTCGGKKSDEGTGGRSKGSKWRDRFSSDSGSSTAASPRARIGIK